MTAPRLLSAATLAILTVAAVLGLRAELRHRDAEQRERALLRIEMHRFGQSTLTNLATWRSDPDPGHRFEVAAEVDGLFAGSVTVKVTGPKGAEGAPAQFQVDSDGAVTPLDPAAQALAARVAAWGDDPVVQARQAEVPAVAPPTEPAPAADPTPPTRPYVPEAP